MAQKRKQSLYRWLFHRSRGDSPITKSIIHLVLIAASIIMIYPALRVLTISLRPGNRALSTTLDIIPTDRVMIPKNFTEKEMNLAREVKPEDFTINKSELLRAKPREISYKYSGTKVTTRIPEKYTDFELEKQMYLNEQKTQELMDAAIQKDFGTLVPMEIFVNGGYFSKAVPGSEKSATAEEAQAAQSLVGKINPVTLAEGEEVPGVPQTGNQAYDLAVSKGLFDIPAYTSTEVVPTDKEIIIRDMMYRRIAPVLKTVMVPANMTWADLEPFVEAQKRTNNDSKLFNADGFSVMMIGGVNIVPEGVKIPWNLGIDDISKEILYLKAGAKQVSYITASSTNYTAAIFGTSFLLWIWNSLLITVSTAFLGVALASTSAYAFSRFRFPGRKVGLIFLLATQMIPAAMLILPIYLLATQLHLIGQWTGLVVAYSVGSIPFSIHILKGYYDTIPMELEEAATIDGATKMQTFFRIMLPLAAPALAIVFLFNFMQAWNDFLLARIMLNESPDRHTWPLGLQKLQSQFSTDWGKFSAAALMVSIPVTILFLASSKYLVSGLTLGSVKG